MKAQISATVPADDETEVMFHVETDHTVRDKVIKKGEPQLA